MLVDQRQTGSTFDDPEPIDDRSMLALQYLTAVIAVMAAALLALVS